MNASTSASPLLGRPRTVERTDRQGRPLFTITTWELTPLGAKAIDQTGSVLGAVFGAIFILHLLYQMGMPSFDLLLAATVGGVLWGTHQTTVWLVVVLARRRTKIVMKVDSISVRRWFGWRHFDRNLEHRFALVAHDKAQREYEHNEFMVRRAAMEGRVERKAVYYGQSAHVVLIYAGHRVDLLTVYGERPAAAIVARLQYCDRRLNETLGMGGGISRLKPAPARTRLPSSTAASRRVTMAIGTHGPCLIGKEDLHGPHHPGYLPRQRTLAS